jgi:hypothetical protein
LLSSLSFGDENVPYFTFGCDLVRLETKNMAEVPNNTFRWDDDDNVVDDRGGGIHVVVVVDSAAAVFAVSIMTH